MLMPGPLLASGPQSARVTTVAVATLQHPAGSACVAHRTADVLAEALGKQASSAWAVLSRTQVLRRERELAAPGSLSGTQLPALAQLLSATVVVGGSVGPDGTPSLVLYDVRKGSSTKVAGAAGVSKALGFKGTPSMTPAPAYPSGASCETYAAARAGFDRRSPKALKTAVKLAKKALKAAPKDPRVLAHVSQVFTRSNNPGEGLKLAIASSAAAPQYVEAHWAQGLAHDYLDAWENAIGSYTTAAAMDRGFGDLRTNLGMVHLRLDDLTNALGHLEQALALDEGSDPARLNLATAAIAATDGTLALRVLKPIRRDSPFKAQVDLTRGQALNLLGRSTEAQGVLAGLLQAPGQLGAEARYEMAVAQLSAGVTDDAKSGFQALTTSQNPKLVVRAVVGLVRVALRTGDLAGADAQLAQLAKNPELRDDPLTLRARALVAVARGDYMNADQMLKAAVARRPRDHEAWYDLGVLRQRHLSKQAEAATAYSRAIAANPRAHWAHQNLGILRLAANKPGEAVAHFRAAYRLHQASGAIANSLGVALARSGKREEALKTWREFVKRAKSARPVWPVPPALSKNLAALEDAAK